MPDIKLTIDGIEYELICTNPFSSIKSLRILFDEKKYIGKAIPSNLPAQDYKILSLTIGTEIYQRFDDLGFIANNNVSIFRENWLLKQPGVKINSVKRISDGEIFKVGDEIEEYGKIKDFYLLNDELLCTCDRNIFCLSGIDFSKIKKVKQKLPLFTTQDGVKIFEHDHYFVVNRDFMMGGMCNGLGWYNPKSGEKYFSTRDSAEEYILQNKPIQVSYKEINGFISPLKSNKVYEFFKSKIKP